jgi:hypothetical protein
MLRYGFRLGSSPAGHRALSTTTLHSEAANSGAKRETGRCTFESCRSPTGRKGPKAVVLAHQDRPRLEQTRNFERLQHLFTDNNQPVNFGD